MKKKIALTSIIIAGLVAILLFCIKLSGSFSSQITDGTYEIKGNDTYKDAYIQVVDNRIRFYNIDLNEIYRQAQYEQYIEMKDRGHDFGLSDEELYEKSDLNKIFVDNEYEVGKYTSKIGTFTYLYYCIDNDINMYGFPIEYNSWDKTIQINSPIKTLIFEK